jgi:hypothetical protein
MKKKEYIEPEMDIIDLSIEGALLDASSPDDEYEGGYGSIIPTEINKQV